VDECPADAGQVDARRPVVGCLVAGIPVVVRHPAVVAPVVVPRLGGVPPGVFVLVAAEQARLQREVEQAWPRGRDDFQWMVGFAENPRPLRRPVVSRVASKVP
jgi:hypothetical protein